MQKTERSPEIKKKKKKKKKRTVEGSKQRNMDMDMDMRTTLFGSSIQGDILTTTTGHTQ